MSTKRKYPGPEKAPYCKGNLQHYIPYFADWEKGSEDREWRDNVPFSATLTLTGIERGQSAMRFLWWDEDASASYPMFAMDMAALAMSKDGVMKAKAAGCWIVMKRGTNYGIARYEA